MATSHAVRGTAPLGIKIICVFALLGSLGTIFLGLGTMGYGGIGTIVGLIVLVIGILYLPIIYGLWTLEGWAWTAYIILGALGLLMQFVSLVFGDVSAIVSILIQGVILAYVYSKRPLYKR